MSRCGIQTIEKGAFETISFGLSNLNLNDNNMTVLKGSPFRDLKLKNL